MFRTALGQAEGIDTLAVVTQVIAACRHQLQGAVPQAGIVYASIHFDHQLMLNLITEAFPGMRLVGCTTAGSYSSAAGFSDDAITLMALALEDESADGIEISSGVGQGLTAHPDAAARQAAEMARDGLGQRPVLCLTLPEGYDVRAQPALAALGEALGSQCTIVGGASATHWTDKIEIYQFHGREVLTDAVPILLIAGPVEFTFAIANSWRPVGNRARVQRAQGRQVQRIGDFTAVDFYRHYLGHHTEPARAFIVSVYEAGRKEAYMRAPISYNPDGSITFSDPIPEGTEVQLTEAVRDDLIRDTQETSERLLGTVQAWEPAFALAFSCAFRKEVLGTEAERELAILKDNFAPNLPISGFFSFGEIAPLVRGGRTLAHGATLIILLVGPKAKAWPLDSDGGEGAPAVSPATLSPSDETAFLKRRLLRSEVYRRRLESMRDFSSRMHQRIRAEIESARRSIQEKEIALRKSEEKFRRIVTTTGEGFILMDEDLTLIDTNDAYCQLVGYPRSELLGKSNLDLATPAFRQFLDTNRDTLLANDSRRFEGALITRDGREVPILVHGNTLRDDRGAVIGHMAFISDMTEQKKALALAGEVQRSLLPQESPRVPGLDVAGRNISCDEVGGDYYDFFWRRGGTSTPFSVAVGDITGHGVDAALLMSTARAFLRLHANRAEPISDIIRAANRHLAEDVAESGRFMTLFYLTIDADLDGMEWVRAGHDPALLYDPDTDRFVELRGPGIALGINDAFDYQPSRHDGLADGQIIAIGTDGIWESYNEAGEMFGRERFKSLLRQHAQRSAGEILSAIFDRLSDFTRGRRPEDDITLVILKIQKKRTL
ncbi:MAG: SpoIIE family protein phosphatase [Desulfosarcinaceae bacterium]|nr:SpoIIE family protein phosphatase [Desulfosarcinaceae bacterium]